MVLSLVWKLCLREWASQVVLVVKNLPASAEDIRDLGSVLGLGGSLGGGCGNPIRYASLENPIDRGVWWTTVHERGCKESDLTEVT